MKIDSLKQEFDNCILVDRSQVSGGKGGNGGGLASSDPSSQGCDGSTSTYADWTGGDGTVYSDSCSD